MRAHVGIFALFVVVGVVGVLPSLEEAAQLECCALSDPTALSQKCYIMTQLLCDTPFALSLEACTNATSLCTYPANLTLNTATLRDQYLAPYETAVNTTLRILLNVLYQSVYFVKGETGCKKNVYIGAVASNTTQCNTFLTSTMSCCALTDSAPSTLCTAISTLCAPNGTLGSRGLCNSSDVSVGTLCDTQTDENGVWTAANDVFRVHFDYFRPTLTRSACSISNTPTNFTNTGSCYLAPTRTPSSSPSPVPSPSLSPLPSPTTAATKKKSTSSTTIVLIVVIVFVVVCALLAVALCIILHSSTLSKKFFPKRRASQQHHPDPKAKFTTTTTTTTTNSLSNTTSFRGPQSVANSHLSSRDLTRFGSGGGSVHDGQISSSKHSSSFIHVPAELTKAQSVKSFGSGNSRVSRSSSMRSRQQQQLQLQLQQQQQQAQQLPHVQSSGGLQSWASNPTMVLWNEHNDETSIEMTHSQHLASSPNPSLHNLQLQHQHSGGFAASPNLARASPWDNVSVGGGSFKHQPSPQLQQPQAQPMHHSPLYHPQHFAAPHMPHQHMPHVPHPHMPHPNMPHMPHPHMPTLFTHHQQHQQPPPPQQQQLPRSSQTRSQKFPDDSYFDQQQQQQQHHAYSPYALQQQHQHPSQIFAHNSLRQQPPPQQQQMFQHSPSQRFHQPPMVSPPPPVQYGYDNNNAYVPQGYIPDDEDYAGAQNPWDGQGYDQGYDGQGYNHQQQQQGYDNDDGGYDMQMQQQYFNNHNKQQSSYDDDNNGNGYQDGHGQGHVQQDGHGHGSNVYHDGDVEWTQDAGY